MIGVVVSCVPGMGLASRSDSDRRYNLLIGHVGDPGAVRGDGQALAVDGRELLTLAEREREARYRRRRRQRHGFERPCGGSRHHARDHGRAGDRKGAYPERARHGCRWRGGRTWMRWRRHRLRQQKPHHAHV